MKNPICFPRWALVACLLGVVTTGHSQANPIAPKRYISAQPVVTEGRSVSVLAMGGTGSVQWQVSSGDKQAWADVTDNATYHGARTNELEITGAMMAMNGLLYRFTDAVGGAIVASDVARLAVSPLLFPSPAGLAFDAGGDLIVSDSSAHTLQRIMLHPTPTSYLDLDTPRFTSSVVPVVGASGVAGSDDGMDIGASFNQPRGLVLSDSSDIIVTDTANSTIRRVRYKTVTTLAGSVSERGNRDGAGSTATFSSPMGVAKGPDGSFYVADTGNHTIRKIGADGMVSTFAGSPGNAGWVDGTGRAARFNSPTGIGVDANGTVYVSDTINNLIRRITPAGAVTTLAGVPGVAGAQDGPGDQAMFNGPTGLAVLASGYLYVADTGNSTIRSIGTDGTVTTYAGVPTVAGLRDDHSYGKYTMGLFNQPRAIFYDAHGKLLYIADTGNAAIRVIDPNDDGLQTLVLSAGYDPNPTLPFTPRVETSGESVSSNKSASDGGSGGGSIGGWLVAALAGAWLLRKFAARSQRRVCLSEAARV